MNSTHAEVKHAFPGAVTLCCYCAGFLTFDDQLKLIKSPPEQAAQMRRDPRIAFICEVVRVMRVRRKAVMN